MNKNVVIANITLIADAAEYFDRKIGSAWKIRAAMTNALVWAANRVINMEKNKNAEPDQLVDARVTLATLRVWANDMNTTSLTLDLLHGSIRRTLGLDREVASLFSVTRGLVADMVIPGTLASLRYSPAAREQASP